MNEQEFSSAKLLKSLEKIGFSRKYYDYYARNSELIYSNQKRFTWTVKDLAAVLSTTPLDFKYKTNEKFFHQVILKKVKFAQFDLVQQGCRLVYQGYCAAQEFFQL